MSESSKVHEAFVAAWSEIETVAHDADNPHFKSSYTTYDAIIRSIRGILRGHCLTFVQAPIPHDGHAAVQNFVMHKDGGRIDFGAIAVPFKKLDDPQAFGSAMTYAKRYGACAVFGIPTGDDDGGAAASAGERDPRYRAYQAVSEWTGLDMAKQKADLDAAARDIAELPKVNGDPMKIIAYCELHGSEDFVEHMNKIKENAQ